MPKHVVLTLIYHIIYYWHSKSLKKLWQTSTNSDISRHNRQCKEMAQRINYVRDIRQYAFSSTLLSDQQKMTFCSRAPRYGVAIAYRHLYWWVGHDCSVGISYSLRAGPSSVWIPVEESFSAPVRTDPGVHPASCIVDIGSLCQR
jgi:hypothetical protein